VSNLNIKSPDHTPAPIVIKSRESEPESSSEPVDEQPAVVRKKSMSAIELDKYF